MEENEKRLEKLAINLLEYSVKLEENENILIEVMGEEALPLAKALFKKAIDKKAKPFFNIINHELLRLFLMQVTPEQMDIYAKNDLARMKQMDAYIGISTIKSKEEKSQIPEENQILYQTKYIKPVYFEQRTKHTKWCILRYPNKEMEKLSGMTKEELDNFYFDSCTLDYSKMEKAMEPLVELMNKTDRVHIVGKGTDLTFSIKGIPAEKYHGNFNIPDGEVATAPVKDSVNGYITYNTKTTYQGEDFENISFTFKDGKIIKATANKEEKLNQILDIDEGARYIGEFALGLNPYVKAPFGDTLFDEKVSGSFHFTPGDSLQESDNGNRSAIHWDIVCIQTPEYGGGEIFFDDVLIRKDGKFVLPELEGLNSESLK